MLKTNKKPISSKPIKVDIKRLTSMGLLPDKMKELIDYLKKK